MDENDLLSTSEAARILGINRRWLRRLITAGRIRALRVGRDYAVSRRDLEAFAEQPRQRGRPRKAGGEDPEAD